MHSWARAGGVALVFVLAAPAAAQYDRCDRACLESLLDRHVDARVARDPSHLPAARGIRFRSGMFHCVTRIRDRRFVAVDPERGLAFAFAFFDNASGDARNVTLADGRKVVSGPAVPWTWQIAEVFKIESGKIGPVESVLHPVPYGMGSGWSSWEDAMSSRPR